MHIYTKSAQYSVYLMLGLPDPTDPTVIAEIRVQEEKLTKARAVKAEMMSVLLTGRIRLIQGENLSCKGRKYE